MIVYAGINKYSGFVGVQVMNLSHLKFLVYGIGFIAIVTTGYDSQCLILQGF